MAWFGPRVYIGANWATLRAADGSFTWTEIRAANPFPSTVGLSMTFRNATGAVDGRFFATRTLPPLAQAFFLVRDLTLPNSTGGWFVLTSSPTPVVPCADIFWSQRGANTEVIDVPIQQLDADGFPIGDADAQPRPPAKFERPTPIASLRQPPVADLWAEGVFGEEHARDALELFRVAQSAPGALDAVKPVLHTVGLLVDDEADEFRSRVGELSKRSEPDRGS